MSPYVHSNITHVNKSFEKSDREAELAILSKNTEQIMNGSGKNIEKFIAKIGRSEFSSKPKKLIFISKHGFTAQAAEYARIDLKI